MFNQHFMRTQSKKKVTSFFRRNFLSLFFLLTYSVNFYLSNVRSHFLWTSILHYFHLHHINFIVSDTCCIITFFKNFICTLTNKVINFIHIFYTRCTETCSSLVVFHFDIYFPLICQNEENHSSQFFFLSFLNEGGVHLNQ